MAPKRRPWKRTKQTTSLVHTIRRKLNDAGYEEELATTPLATMIRFDKETLEIVEEKRLAYNMKRDNIRRVFRDNV